MRDERALIIEEPSDPTYGFEDGVTVSPKTTADALALYDSFVAAGLPPPHGGYDRSDGSYVPGWQQNGFICCGTIVGDGTWSFYAEKNGERADREDVPIGEIPDFFQRLIQP